MRKYIYIIACVLAMALSACQVIPEENRYVNAPVIEVDAPVAGGGLNMARNVLLVEYTGFRCLNCPLAAEEAHRLQQQYPDNLVVVAMHPKSNSFCQTSNPLYDFTCPEADIYFKAIGGSSSTGFPVGDINMTTGLVQHELWGGEIGKALAQKATAKLSFTIEERDAALREYDIHYRVTTGNTDDLYVIFWLTEDGYVGPQTQPDGKVNREYVHNHLLRTAFTPEWGVAASAEPQTLSVAIPEKQNNQPITMANCHIVGVIIDKDHHVVNVAEVRINKD